MNEDTKSGRSGLVYQDPNSEWADRTGPNPAWRNIHMGERRSGTDRRDSRAAGRGTALRANEVDGRAGNDRRRVRIGVSIRTAWAIDGMADWLEANSRGKWSIVLSDIKRQEGTQEVNVMFERQADADKFIRLIAGGRGVIV
jgi:hypothetical protein